MFGTSLVLFLFFQARCAHAASSPDPVVMGQFVQMLKERVESRFPVTAGGERLRMSGLVREFYQGRNYGPAWSSGEGFGPLVDDLMKSLQTTHEEGLGKVDYHQQTLNLLIDEIKKTPERRGVLNVQWIDLDLLLTDAFLSYASDLSIGHVSPKVIGAYLPIQPQLPDLPLFLEKVLQARKMSESLRQLGSMHPGYEDLRKALKSYRELAAKSSQIPSSPDQKRIRQIEINMEYRRWLPPDLPGKRIMVNIPDFSLKAFEDGVPVLEMKVVVGQRREWHTPALNSQITNLILNPKWHVPPGIIKKEMLSKLKEEPGYFAQNKMTVTQVDAEGQAIVVDPAAIDWAHADTGEGKIKIVQKSGRGNALGKIKFMFPNPFDIYLHDTPQQSGFQKSMRALSHGCVRLEKPMDLANYLLKDNSSWPIEKINTALQKPDVTAVVPLKNPVPLFIHYWTVWVDEKGEVQFRDDLYGLDKKVDSRF